MELIPHHLMHVFLSGCVALFLIFFGFIANRRLRKMEECIIPSDKPTPSTLFEVTVESILGLMEGVLGKRAWHYFPLIGSAFIYIFVCNLIGLIPGLESPTSNTNTNAAIAILVFLYYNYLGVKEHGAVGYLKHFFGPLGGNWKFILITIIFFGIELISHAARPLSLSVRLFGNMTGDHMVVGVFSELVPLLVPVIFLLLGLFISFIQAFVFSLLSIVYIGLATETEHH